MPRLAAALAFLCLLIPGPLSAQDLLLAGEEEAPPVTADDVRAALGDLLAEAGPNGAEAQTTAQPDIDLPALDILLEPLKLDEISTEIAGWEDLVITAVEDLSQAELKLFEINSAETAAADTGTEPPTDPTALNEKNALIDEIAGLRETRTALADRLKLVMDAYEAKGGAPEDTALTRAYIADVGGVRVDTRNFETTLLTIREWVTADDGGLRLLREASTVLLATLGGLVIGWIVARIFSFGLKTSSIASTLLRRFVRKWVTWLGAIIGFFTGLSWIGTNMTPILAVLGGIGFILAFALQNTISNFASGLLILLQKPFDAGDEIEAAGVSGHVDTVSLFTTHLSTSENRKVIVPNNMIWDDVVVNSTGAATRRLSIEIEVNAEEHGVDDAEQTLMRLMKAHPGVLEDPEPVVTLTALTAEALTFTCWPWVATEDKDKVRWELVSRFGRELSVLKGVTKAAS